MSEQSNHTLVIALSTEDPGVIVQDARDAGLPVNFRDTKMPGWTERHWTVFCTEKQFEQLIEFRQP